MSIEKIIITETVWKDGQRFLREKEYSRDEHKGDFDEFILEELDDSDRGEGGFGSSGLK